MGGIGGALSNDLSDIPDSFDLHRCYPNPFNPITNISFAVPELSKVKIDAYSINGEYITSIIDRYYQSGEYTIPWNAKSLSSGAYLIKMHSGDFIKTQKVMLLK